MAKELGSSTAKVSKSAKKLAAGGKIEIDKRRYRPIENFQSSLDRLLHEHARKIIETRGNEK